MLLGLAFAVSVIETVGLTMITSYSKTHFLPTMLGAMSIYGLAVPMFIYKTLHYAGIGTVNFMWNIITTVSMIIIGTLMFGEKLDRLHMMSMVLGMSSIVLLYFAERYA
jgi:multidrug transporter EmrE-like cation transporter